MKVFRMKRNGARHSKPKLLRDSKLAGVGSIDGTISITSFGGTDYDYRIELSEDEVRRLNNYRRAE
jgi:hypothetical protein